MPDSLEHDTLVPMSDLDWIHQVAAVTADTVIECQETLVSLTGQLASVKNMTKRYPVYLRLAGQGFRFTSPGEVDEFVTDLRQKIDEYALDALYQRRRALLRMQRLGNPSFSPNELQVIHDRIDELQRPMVLAEAERMRPIKERLDAIAAELNHSAIPESSNL